MSKQKITQAEFEKLCKIMEPMEVMRKYEVIKDQSHPKFTEAESVMIKNMSNNMQKLLKIFTNNFLSIVIAFSLFFGLVILPLYQMYIDKQAITKCYNNEDEKFIRSAMIEQESIMNICIKGKKYK